MLVARHGERLDYVYLKRGDNWTATAARPWDPPLTETGLQQACALGAGILGHIETLGLPPILQVCTSPFLRCVQTAVAAASALGVGEVCVEPGLAEGMLDDWCTFAARTELARPWAG